MKFTLAENIKCILSEKYLLNERYILNEATNNTDLALSWSTEIKKHLPEVRDIINKVKNTFKTKAHDIKLEQFSKDLDTAKKGVETALKLPNATTQANDTVKNNLNEYYKIVDELVRELKVNASGGDEINGPEGLIAILNDFKQAISLDAWNIAAQRKALNIFNKLAKAVDDTIKSTLNVLYQANNKNSEQVEAIQDLCDKALDAVDKLENSYLITNKDSKLDDAALQPYLDILKNNLQPAINLVKKNKNVADKSAEDLQNIFGQLIKAIEAVKAATDNTAIKRATSQKQNWATRYKACKTPEDFDTFWKEYFSEEWQDKAKDVENFGILFINDTEKYGFDAINNIIIKFLKTPIIYNLIGNTFNLAAYTVIHNAIAGGLINSSDLKASDISTFGASNIIFNPKLYDNITSALDYLKVQAKLASTGRGGSLETALQQIWKGGQDGHVKILNNLILAEGDGDEFSKDINSAGKALPLRDLAEAKQILEQLTGTSFEDKSDATNTDITNILKNITTADYAKGVLAFLVDYCMFNDLTTAVNKADDQLKTAGSSGIYIAYQRTPRPDRKTAEDYSKLLRIDTLEFKQPQMIELLLDIAKIANI